MEPLSEKPQVTKTNSRKWRLIFGGLILVAVAVALGVGLGIGLTRRHHTHKSASAVEGPTSFPQNISAVSTKTPEANTVSGSTWQPTVGATWNYQLSATLTPTSNFGSYSIWIIDVFDTSAATIKAIQDKGAKVVCYFSAGSYEDWRPDASSFQPADIGATMADWEGESWLDTRSSNVRNIMAARMDLAVSKGCNGLDPDNVDGYSNVNGVGLTQADGLDYLNFLTNAAHSRGLSIGLKNTGDLVGDVVNTMDWSVDESCLQYSECTLFQPFIDQGKPVFHVEYPKGEDVNNNKPVADRKRNKICNDATRAKFSTIMKNYNLDGWAQAC